MLEYVYKTIGEVCLHFFVLIVTVSLFTYYFESLAAVNPSAAMTSSSINSISAINNEL